MRDARMRTPPTIAASTLLCCLAALLWGCPEITGELPYSEWAIVDDDDTGDDDDSADDDDAVEDCDLTWIEHTDEEVSLSSALEPMFFDHCSNCHVPYVLGGLSLAPGQSWGDLVDVPNMLGYGQGMVRVAAGDPEGSYLMHKLVRCDAEDPDWGHYQGPMPPDLPKSIPLDGAQVGQIWAWIEQGAADN